MSLKYLFYLYQRGVMENIIPLSAFAPDKSKGML